MNTRYIIAGYARAINKLIADKPIDDDDAGIYILAFETETDARHFLWLCETTLCCDKYIVSEPGRTYHWITGTDVSITTTSSSLSGMILIPYDKATIKFLCSISRKNS
jgi:hypothetical protein